VPSKKGNIHINDSWSVTVCDSAEPFLIHHCVKIIPDVSGVLQDRAAKKYPGLQERRTGGSEYEW
jgi:hypothetical protein